MSFHYCATVPVEIAHKSVEGDIHGHTLMVEVWTSHEVDLDQWQARVARELAPLEKGLLEDIVGRTFEDVINFTFHHVAAAEKVVLRLPSRGHAIESERAHWDMR